MTTKTSAKSKRKDEWNLTTAEIARKFVEWPVASYEVRWAAKYRQALVDALVWPTGTFDLERNARIEAIRREQLRLLADKLDWLDLVAVVKLATVLARVKPDAELPAYIEANSAMWQQAAAVHFRKVHSASAKRGWKTRKQHARAVA